MNIIEEMLSKVEHNDLVNIIERYSEVSDNGINMTEHLKIWAKEKTHIYELFGNKLTLEREVDTVFSSEKIKGLLYKFFREEFFEEEFVLIRTFLNQLQGYEIGNNRLEEDFTFAGHTFKKGIKISKCFRDLTKKIYLEEANIRYSMFLQSIKTKGTAVLSIDPKDYLTMSANNSGWSSCHSLDDQFRVGTVSYMLDGASVISYLKSSEDCLAGDTVFANKTWRQIVLINPTNQYALQLRQYPNENELNCDAVGEMLIELIEKWTGVAYQRGVADTGNPRLYQLQKDGDFSHLYYNDVYHCGFADCYYTIPKDKQLPEFHELVAVKKEIPRAVVGGEVKCLCGCGTVLHESEWLFDGNESYSDPSWDGDYDDNGGWSYSEPQEGRAVMVTLDPGHLATATTFYTTSTSTTTTLVVNATNTVEEESDVKRVGIQALPTTL